MTDEERAFIKTLNKELSTHKPFSFDNRFFYGGAVAAIQCYQHGGRNRLDGITLSETGGRMKSWKPKGKEALEGWEWMWDRIEQANRP